MTKQDNSLPETSHNCARQLQPSRTAVAIVDDDQQVLDILVLYLRSVGYRTRAFNNATDLIELLDWSSGIGCIVTDVRMPGMDGLTLLSEIRRRDPSLPVILMTGHGDVPMAVKAIRDGAMDFLEKPLRPEQLENAIAYAIKNAEDASRAQSDVQNARRALAELSPQQARILDLIVQGLTNKEIALVLGNSYRTIETHRAVLMDRLQARSLADLIRMKLLAGDTSPVPRQDLADSLS